MPQLAAAEKVGMQLVVLELLSNHFPPSKNQHIDDCKSDDMSSNITEHDTNTHTRAEGQYMLRVPNEMWNNNISDILSIPSHFYRVYRITNQFK